VAVRVLITGAAGQLGRELVQAFAGHEVVAADAGTMDLRDRDAVLQVTGAVRPDTVVHAGAWTAVDGCELDPDRAWAVNALGTRNVAEGADRVGAGVCYLSTDYIFDGTSPQAYTEWDRPNPLSVYGRSKLGGELELPPGSLVVRTSWLFGPTGDNMVRTVLRLAAEGRELAFVDDQRGCPTYAPDLAAMVRHLVVARRPGTFHITNQGATTWFQLARDVLALAGHDPERVRPIATADLRPPRPAPRPANSVLDNTALRLSGTPLLPDHHEPLERTVKELLS